MEFKKDSVLAPVTDERLAWFEQAYDIRLPLDYVDFLRTGNGGIPIKRNFPQGRRMRMIERMLCLLPKPQADAVNGCYDITVVLTQVDSRLTENEDLAGADVIPIAELFAGDLVCLDLRYSFSCPVVVWDHEQSDDFHPVFEAVADSFSEFVRLLR